MKLSKLIKITGILSVITVSVLLVTTLADWFFVTDWPTLPHKVLDSIYVFGAISLLLFNLLGVVFWLIYSSKNRNFKSYVLLLIFFLVSFPLVRGFTRLDQDRTEIYEDEDVIPVVCNGAGLGDFYVICKDDPPGSGYWNN